MKPNIVQARDITEGFIVALRVIIEKVSFTDPFHAVNFFFRNDILIHLH